MSGKEAKSLSLTTFLRVFRNAAKHKKKHTYIPKESEREGERNKEREGECMGTFFIWFALSQLALHLV